ncbi:MAG: hypothetical protein VW999_14405 [Alphaproteobacteria bacterium]
MSNIDIKQAVALRVAFDQIEEAYEYMLSYAAQGRREEVDEGGGESHIRQYIRKFLAAALQISDSFMERTAEKSQAEFIKSFCADAGVVASIMSLLLSEESISSHKIDNVNGMIKIRSYLSDIFFIDQIMLPERGEN